MGKSRKPNPNNRIQSILYGRHPVLAVIANPERSISKIICTKDNFDELKEHCKNHDVNIGLINTVDRKEIDRIIPRESVHQGFAVYCSELEEYTIEDLCILADQKEDCHVLVLDQVTDPQNIGAIIRSCVAFNTIGLVLQDKNSPNEKGSMAKASAGMIEHLPICRVVNLSRAVQQFKEAGFWTIGMDSHAKTTISEMNKKGKTAIIMGSEGKGMRRLVEESCDSTIRLDTSDKVESLNVSTATAIVLYELNKG